MTDALVVLSVVGAGSVAMPRRTIVDPHWEPVTEVVTVRFTATQLHTLYQLVSELRVTSRRVHSYRPPARRAA